MYSAKELHPITSTINIIQASCPNDQQLQLNQIHVKILMGTSTT